MRLIDILEFLITEDRGASLNWIDDIEDIEQLENLPEIARDFLESRKINPKKYPNLGEYQVIGHKIEFLNLRH